MMRLSDWVAADADSVGDSEATSAADERLVAAFAVCDCGICEHGLVDEDGLCASCGVCPILVADRASAEEVVGLREDVEAATARAEAAEARAAQAEADARLMAGLAFASFVARTSFSTEIVEASLLDALEAAGDHTAAVSDADLIATARRILAGVQPTPSPTAT